MRSIYGHFISTENVDNVNSYEKIHRNLQHSELSARLGKNLFAILPNNVRL